MEQSKSKKRFTKGNRLRLECIKENKLKVYQSKSSTDSTDRLVLKGQVINGLFDNLRPISNSLVIKLGDICYSIQLEDGVYTDCYSKYFKVLDN